MWRKKYEKKEEKIPEIFNRLPFIIFCVCTALINSNLILNTRVEFDYFVISKAPTI